MSTFPKPVLASMNSTNDPLILLGFRADGSLLAVLPNGQLQWCDASEVAADWQFDWRRLEWIDMSPWSVEDAEVDQEDDRGKGIQGYVPDADRTSDGDQGDTADHDPGDVDTSEDGAN